MIRVILALAVLALSACDAEEKLPSLTQAPSADAPTIPTPSPVVTQKQFLDLFADLCLVAPRNLSYFRSTAQRLGLGQTKKYEGHGTKAYGWGKQDERRNSALEVSVGSGPILYEVVGNPSGLPNRIRHCSVSAFLAENDTEAQRTIAARIRKDFEPRAKELDFSSYSENYDVTKKDISIDVTFSQRSTYLDMRPNSNCPRGNPCWTRTPYELSLEVVIGRIP